MDRNTKSREGGRLGLFASALALGALLTLAGGPDAAAACERIAFDGTVRRCTVTENFSQCWKDAEDAYWRCIRRNPGWLGQTRCSLLNNLDQLGCLVETGAFSVVRGFLST